MSDNELLLAISNMMDKKLDSKLASIKKDIEMLKDGQNRTNLILENEVRHDIKTLAENYLPSAERFEKKSGEIESIQADIEIIKKVISEHSDKLQKIS